MGLHRRLLALLLGPALLVPLLVLDLEAGAVPCARTDPVSTVGGTIEGSDGHFVNAQISLALVDAEGVRVGLDGCPLLEPGYSTVIAVNDTMPGSGSPDDGGGAYTKSWELGGLPANAETVWVEVYSKKTWPEREGPGDGGYSGSHHGETPLDQPLDIVLGHADGVDGMTGGLTGIVTVDAQPARADWVSAWALEPAAQDGPLGFGAEYVGIDGTYHYPTLAAGSYQVWASYRGDVRKAFGVPVDAGTTTARHFAFGRYQDVPYGHPFWPAISWVLREGALVPGGDDFAPTTTVNRIQAILALWRLAGEPGGYAPTPFHDLDALVPDQRAAVRWAWATGVSAGFADQTFRPFDPLVRQAASAYLHRVAGSPPSPGSDFSDVPPGHPFYAAVSWMAAEGITVGYPDGTFGASRDLLRQAYAAFVHRANGSPIPTVVDPLPIDDVDLDDPDHDAIWWMLANDYLRFGKEGPLEGAFGPEQTVRRREVLRVLHRHAGFPVPPSPPGYPDPGFCDVSFVAFGWLQITWAADQGIIDTDTACFGRIDPAGRGDTLRWLWRYAGAPVGAPDPGASDVGPADEVFDALAWAVDAGVVDLAPGEPFDPDGLVTRRQLARWFHRQVA